MVALLQSLISKYCTVYQNTKEERYLDTSRRMATYFVDNTPSNGIVPWSVHGMLYTYVSCKLIVIFRDFNAPDNSDRPADSSAAMITAMAFIVLSQIEQSLSPSNTSGSDFWLENAFQVSDSCELLICFV